MHTFDLPQEIADMVHARNRLRAYYNKSLADSGSAVELKFTFDGNLVGDLGEALAVQQFGIKLVETSSTEGIDGYTDDGKYTVQVKATGTGRGPAFRQTDFVAMLAGGVFSNQQDGIGLWNGGNHYRTMATAFEAFISAALAVGEFQINPLQAVMPEILFLGVMNNG